MNVIAKAKPKMEIVRPTRTMGYVRDQERFFEAEKRRILNKLGDLSDIRVPLNRILVSIWATDEEYRSEGGLLIHRPDQTKDENKWQGVSALVVKMGPHCYAKNPDIEFVAEDRCEVGDWVLFRKGSGFRVEAWLHECVMLENEKSIYAILDRPDMVF
jgi:co-chaperonin GroES (HSP10)